MAITIEELKQFNQASLNTYVWNRVHEFEPADPPVSDNNQNLGDYNNFLIGAAIESRQEKSPLAQKIAFAVSNAFLGIARYDGHPRDYNATAVSNLGMIAIYITNELRELPNGVARVQEIALMWTEQEAPQSRTGLAGKVALNALALIQRQGDDTRIWEELWHKENRPDLWNLSYLGLVRSGLNEATEELPTLYRRSISQVPTIGPESWMVYLYNETQKTPAGLEMLMRKLRSLDIQEAIGLISLFERTNLPKEEIAVLLNTIKAECQVPISLNKYSLPSLNATGLIFKLV